MATTKRFGLMKMSSDLLQRRVHNGKSWGEWETVFVRPRLSMKDETTTDDSVTESFTFDFGSGERGSLTVYTGILHTHQREALSCSFLSCNLFRQYKIQGGPEPRTHFLVHEDATEDWET
jgi:hypothetical protein